MLPEKMTWNYNMRTHSIESNQEGRRAFVAIIPDDRPAELGEFIARAPGMHGLASYMADVYKRLNDRVEQQQLWTLRGGEDFANSVLAGNPDPENLKNFAKASFKTLPKEDETPADWHFQPAQNEGDLDYVRDASGKEISNVHGASDEERALFGKLIALAPVTHKVAHYLFEQINESMLSWYSEDIGTSDDVYNFVMELNAMRACTKFLLTGERPEQYSDAMAIALSGMFIEKTPDKRYQINLNSRLSGIASAYGAGVTDDGKPLSYPTLREAQSTAFDIIERHNAVTSVDEEMARIGMEADAPAP